MAVYPGDNGGTGNGRGQIPGSENPGPWDTTPYDPNEGGGGGGGNDCSGPGMVKSGLDANGDYLSGFETGAYECVDQAEWLARKSKAESRNKSAGAPPSGGQSGPKPAGAPSYGKAPTFNAPQFSFGEVWNAPSAEDAFNDPGYQFRQSEGLRALQQSAAARGLLGSGGTLKDINAWGQNFAKQEYGDVFNRALQGYNTRFNTASGIFDRNYRGAKDAFDPRMTEWLTNAHAADLGWQEAWNQWNRDNLSAQDIWNKSA